MYPTWGGRLIVTFVLLLISFIAYSSQIFIIWPWYGNALSIELITLLLPFNLLVFMLFWNYILCIVTDPGRVPENWRPDTHAEGYEVKKLTGAPRYCRVCEKYKPPRTHHCRSCKRCVLRMDHHCPWIHNCVGHHNYGHFIRFLFYVDVACSYHLAMVTRRVYTVMGDRYWDEPSTVELVFTILNYVACIPVILLVGGFSLFHFRYLCSNTTTIEGWEKDKAAAMVRHGKLQEVKYPYDLGTRKNIESVLGKRMLLWCWPTGTPGTGLRFQLSSRNGEPVVWPPREPQTRGEFVLPSSPWTYENGTFNPALQPFNSARREAKKRRLLKQELGTYSVPPYHPDYQVDERVISEEDSSSECYFDNPRTKVRRGSEGYEVRPANREDMLARYLKELGEDPSRYHRYIPEPESQTDDGEDDCSLATQDDAVSAVS